MASNTSTRLLLLLLLPLAAVASGREIREKEDMTDPAAVLLRLLPAGLLLPMVLLLPAGLLLLPPTMRAGEGRGSAPASGGAEAMAAVAAAGAAAETGRLRPPVLVPVLLVPPALRMLRMLLSTSTMPLPASSPDLSRADDRSCCCWEDRTT